MVAAADPDIQIFPLGDFPLSCGAVLPSAFLAYKTFGRPDLPCVIYPTWYSGLIADNEWLIGSGMALDPTRYFVVVPALFGNGQSASPSNLILPTTGNPFPPVSLRDNVAAQHRLVTERLGVGRARAVLGWSMGAAQTYQWATQFPDFVERAVPFCGSARTSLHNRVFLEGVKSALLAGRGASSAGVCSSNAADRPWSAREREVGLKALGRVYAGWGFSQAFYRERLYETALGFRGLEEFMTGFWEAWALSKDPENMLVMLHTWQTGDVSDQPPYNKDFELAMRSIKAKMLVLPGKTDLYFPPEDCEYEVQCMADGVGKCIAFPSIWGHWAGGPGQSKEDARWLNAKLKAFLEEGTW